MKYTCTTPATPSPRKAEQREREAEFTNFYRSALEHIHEVEQLTTLETARAISYFREDAEDFSGSEEEAERWISLAVEVEQGTAARQLEEGRPLSIQSRFVTLMGKDKAVSAVMDEIRFWNGSREQARIIQELKEKAAARRRERWEKARKEAAAI